MPLSVPNTADRGAPGAGLPGPAAPGPNPPTRPEPVATGPTRAAPAAPGAAARSRASDAGEGRDILPTLNEDGSRRWIHPRPSPGRFLTARRVTAYGLIALFAALPHIRVGGRPLILLDLIARRFHILGGTFYPTDTLLLALLLVGTFLTIFWLTALLGRVWCGWACPQTVYMEFVYRPIERLLQGTPGRSGRGWLQTSGAGTIVKHAVSLAVSLALAHTFLSYFVGWDHLKRWVFGSPFDHPVGFGVVMFVTAAMMFDFSYFREQVCLVACPYGRLQSVLLDRHSLCVRYDAGRGEPRGRMRKGGAGPRPASPSDTDPAGALPALSLPVLTAAGPGPGSARNAGDCVDCRLCVTTCPTGIDIRNGLQMECVNCTQCIDACDAVMDRIGRPRGLIRYTSEAALAGEPFRALRPRVMLYPAAILTIAALFVIVLLNTGVADVTVLRGAGRPYAVLPGGEVENNIRVKVVNRTDHAAEFRLGIAGIGGARLSSEMNPARVGPGEMLTIPAQIFAPAGAIPGGRAIATITVSGPDGFAAARPYTVLGPAGGTAAPPAPTPPPASVTPPAPSTEAKP